MEELPVLLSIPHGGMDIPAELEDRIVLSAADIFEDIDPYTREIYDLGDSVTHVVSTAYPRTFVDLNRAPDDLPPDNPDGVVKSHTCYGKTIYQSGMEPDSDLKDTLLEKYYFPYHNEIERLSNSKDPAIALALDCHSMAAVGPAISPDRGKKRPMVCLGNAHGRSCSQEAAAAMAACFRRAFSLEENDVTINRPFAGGYITRRYGGHPLPWIQVELNRDLYLRETFFNRRTLSVDKSRILEIRQMFEEALRLYCGNQSAL